VPIKYLLIIILKEYHRRKSEMVYQETLGFLTQMMYAFLTGIAMAYPTVGVSGANLLGGLF
jgi:hypothetical protein